MNRTFFHISDEAAYIRGIQLRLREIGRRDKRITEVFIDGIYGEETKQAVKDLQRLNGLAVTGELDRATFELIDALYEEILISTEVLGLKPKFTEYEGGVMRTGDSFDDIYMLQLLLRELSLKDDRFYVEIDGTFNPQTEIAVKLLQESLRYEQNGEVDIKLWNALVRLTENTDGYL